MRVGFIGLGTMGGKMAASLQRAGVSLVVHDARREAAAAHLEAGAQWADTPREVAQASDVVFTSLPEPADVEAVASGEDGLLAGMRAGAAYFDLSTNSPTVVRRIHAAFAQRGAHMLDAPGQRWPTRSRDRQAGDLGRRRRDHLRAP
jgi:3-hydroxyisobutyrate dehydrogenase